MYKKQLPFYILDEYYEEEEINNQDISFLIWYFLNTVQEEKFIAPFNNFIVETAEKVMAVFDEAWDNAPENEYLKTFYQINENEEDFVRNYTEYFNNSLNLSAKERAEAKQRARKDGFFGTEGEHKDYSEVSETGLVFFNPKSGVEIALAVNCAFPLPNNPFFEVEHSEDDVMLLLVSEEMSTELAMYCIDNCKIELPFFNKGVGKMYLDDIDFLFDSGKKIITTQNHQ